MATLLGHGCLHRYATAARRRSSILYHPILLSCQPRRACTATGTQRISTVQHQQRVTGHENGAWSVSSPSPCSLSLRSTRCFSSSKSISPPSTAQSKLRVAVPGHDSAHPENNVLLGEGVMYDSEADLVYWVDITSKKLHVYNPNTGKNTTITLPHKPGTVVATRQKGILMVPMANGLSYVSLSSGGVYWTGVDPESHIPDNRFNDGKCDPSGRLFVGTMHIDAHTENTAAFYRVDPDLTVTKVISPVTISNGLAWTRDTKTFYYIDSPQYTVAAYDFDNRTGNISNPRVVMRVDPAWGKPDGMTIDANDNLWIAAWNGSKIIQYDPRRQKELYRLQIPARYVTSVCFGGKNLTDLYITCASVGEGWPADYNLEPMAGSLFVLPDCGVQGVASVPFAGTFKE